MCGAVLLFRDFLWEGLGGWVAASSLTLSGNENAIDGQQLAMPCQIVRPVPSYSSATFGTQSPSHHSEETGAGCAARIAKLARPNGDQPRQACDGFDYIG